MMVKFTHGKYLPLWIIRRAAKREEKISRNCVDMKLCCIYNVVVALIYRTGN